MIGKAPLGADADSSVERADLVIIDAEPIDHNVFATARRACPDAQVIALSRQFSEADCVEILDAGADYLARPFRAHDLAARVRVAARRRFNATGRPRAYRIGLLAFDLFDLSLTINGRLVDLAPSELGLLSFLAGQPGVAVDYKRLVAELGLRGLENGRRAPHSCVFRLRCKIERNPLRPEILLTEAGVGYRLAASNDLPRRRARDSLPIEQETGRICMTFSGAFEKAVFG